MIIIKTKNSLYGIKPDGKDFVIRKLQEIKPSSYIQVGEERRSAQIHIEVGRRAGFDGWSTSIVQSVMEAETPRTVEP